MKLYNSGHDWFEKNKISDVNVCEMNSILAEIMSYTFYKDNL